jgi:ABC-type amino acid transport substrate-binding protein
LWELKQIWHVSLVRHRRIKFVELSWDQQISALLSGKTDIIMPGMSITQARKVRIDFTDSYLKSGLVAAFCPEGTENTTPCRAFLTVL